MINKVRLFAVFGSLCCVPSWCWAHVKWFSRDADCTMSPLNPLQIITAPDFLKLGGIALAMMILAAWVDARFGQTRGLLKVTNAIDARVQPWISKCLRWLVAAFFVTAVCYFNSSPVFLTPELKTYAQWVAPLQLIIAVLLLQRRTAWLGALGIVILYMGAIATYGWFHLLDYPVFLGVACYIALDSLYAERTQELALIILRVSAGVTLMWGGAEKWLYPWWSYPMLEGDMKGARLGFSSSFFMFAAGYIEFCAAFALAFGRFIPQIAAIVLLVPFVGAIPAFGAVDAVGHAPIIVVLVILTLTRTRVPSLQFQEQAASKIMRYVLSSMLSVLGIIGLYWVLQHFAYRKPGLSNQEMTFVAVLLMLPLISWLVSQCLALMHKKNGHPSLASAVPLLASDRVST